MVIWTVTQQKCEGSITVVSTISTIDQKYTALKSALFQTGNI